MTSPLVTTDWLAAHLNEPNLRIVDIRGHVENASQPPPHYFAHRDDYDQSHLPGAVFVDWTQDIVEPGSKSQDVASPERYAAFMSQIGIDDKTFVVTYDDCQGMFAARLWWTLRYYGHTQVAVLDGGWDKWIAEGRSVTAEVPQISPVQFTARPNPALRATAADISRLMQTDVSLIDMRSPEEFAGQASRASRMGHIPGALNLPRKMLVNAQDGTLLPPERLAETFAAAGIDLGSGQPVVTYCNAGVSASFGYLALAALGIDHAAMYDGSWKDWGNDVSLPIEQ